MRMGTRAKVALTVCGTLVFLAVLAIVGLRTPVTEFPNMMGLGPRVQHATFDPATATIYSSRRYTWYMGGPLLWTEYAFEQEPEEVREALEEDLLRKGWSALPATHPWDQGERLLGVRWDYEGPAKKPGQPKDSVIVCDIGTAPEARQYVPFRRFPRAKTYVYHVRLDEPEDLSGLGVPKKP